jgi:alanine racemase
LVTLQPDAGLFARLHNRHERPMSLTLRPTVASIDLAALAHNLAEVRRLSPGMHILAVVKADGYGHGSVPCARTLEKHGAYVFGVALVEEALELRQAGIRKPIVVLGGPYGDFTEVVANDLWPVIFLPEHLRGLDAAARSASKRVLAHVKLDTGMGRIGLLPDQLAGFAEASRSCGNVVLDGLLSHFANADLADQELTRKQLVRFHEGIAILRQAGAPLTYRHISNSAGVMDLPEARDGKEFNLVRPGIMLYGHYPADRFRATTQLRPVLTWKTAVVQVKSVSSGVPISYGGKFVTRRPSRIATLPVGYADGYSRRLTNVGEVLVRGKRAPIAGTVCMDMCMADVTDIPGVDVGDEVVLLGRQGEAVVSADEIAQKCGTIHYEVLCGISARVPRIASWSDPPPFP